jgi:capsular exopolysaccharide synthesis family protein
MGKVYEALKRAEKEKQPIFSSFRSEGREARRGTAAAAARKKNDEFDFVDYSLNTPAATDLVEGQEQIGSDFTPDFIEQTACRTARETELDVTRIDPHLVAFYDFDPRASEQYNKLAGAIISSSTERRIKRIMIASASSGEGRTCVMLNLACALANAKQRVLVVDTDLYKPSVLRLLGIDAEFGMAEAVAQESSAGNAAIKVQPHGFAVLPTRDRVDNSAQLLASPVFRSMLDAFDIEYDFILFDSPPLLGSSDSSLLRRYTDATLMVIRSGKTSSKQLEKAIASFNEDNIVGVVINRAA